MRTAIRVPLAGKLRLSFTDLQRPLLGRELGKVLSVVVVLLSLVSVAVVFFLV